MYFGPEHVGCWIDGALGLDHACSRLYELASPFTPAGEDDTTMAALDTGADALADDHAEIDWAVESYIDDCLLEKLGEVAQRYFDYDAFKRDARHDGRGHWLASYDSDEHEQQVGGVWYYIYRVN